MGLCSKCGKELADDAKFCANCGAPVGGAENAENKTSVADKAKAVADKMKEAAKNFNAQETAKAAGEKAKAAGSKLKELFAKLPFNGMAAKVPALAKVAGFANYAVCALGAILLIVVISAITPSGKTDKKLNGEWMWKEKEVFSFDNGKVTFFSVSEGGMTRGTYKTDKEEDTITNSGKEIPIIRITMKELYNFEKGKWVKLEEPYKEGFIYVVSDDDKLSMMDEKLDDYDFKKGKYLKKLIANETENAKKRKKTAAKKPKQAKSKELIAIESKIKEDYDATPEELVAGSFAAFGILVSDGEITDQLVNFSLKDDSAKVKDIEDIIQLLTVMSFDDPSSVKELVRRGKAKVKSLNDKVEQIIEEKEKAAKEKEKVAEYLKKNAPKYKKKLSKNLAANKVKIDNFEMQKTEVTQIMYYAVTDNNPSEFLGENLPVEQVSWYDAIIFCNKLSECTKLNPCYSVKGTTDTSKWGNPQRYKWNEDENKYEPDGECDYTPDDIEWNKDADGWRLPTAEEWAKAADDGHKYSGSDTIDDVAWYSQNSDKKPHDVASKNANSNGIYDMSGNVYEWCWDKEEQKEGARLLRSGAYKYNDTGCEVSYRFGIDPTRSNEPIGIRLVRNAK